MTEVEETVDQRLARMEEIQLISKQYKKEEVTYLFKHALAQEATYESILLKRRKELHLKTAHVIEKIFADKLSEFYGILAWHFSKGEDYIKSEEYLLKAGEEALRTSASREAIHYFQEGLKLYRSRYGKEADPGKIFDNNIVNLWVLIATAKLLAKKRKLQEALSAIDQSIDLSKKVDDRAHFSWAYETKAYIQFLMEDIPGAEQSMEQGSQFSQAGTLYVMKTTEVLSQLLIQLHHLENELSNGGKTNPVSIRSETRKTIREAVRVAGKIADDRLEILKCSGTYHWITGKRRKALKWWKKGILEGERLEALPELARLYLEIGRRLGTDKAKDQTLNGLSAGQYLDKAANLFRELDLQQDLEAFRQLQET